MDRYILTFSYCVHSAPRGLLAKRLKEVTGSLWSSNKTLEPKLQEAVTNHQKSKKGMDLYQSYQRANVLKGPQTMGAKLCP